MLCVSFNSLSLLPFSKNKIFLLFSSFHSLNKKVEKLPNTRAICRTKGLDHYTKSDNAFVVKYRVQRHTEEQHCTMLQKLSKCEVKAARNGHFSNLPPLRFYVKSNFGKLKQSKNVIFANFRHFEF